MALSAFFLVTTEDEREEVRDAGWVYLVATHTATLCLFALFALLRLASGNFGLAPLSAAVPPGLSTAIFVLALIGFGIKAGIMPLHVWLPSAHATPQPRVGDHVGRADQDGHLRPGPHHVALPASARGLGRNPARAGHGLGRAGRGVAIGQHDLKRLLAYHSIENIGIIVMGLGLALLGRSLNRGELGRPRLERRAAARLEPRVVQVAAVSQRAAR